MRVFNNLLVAFFAWMVLAILYSQVEALDDFNLMKYGPDDTIEVKRTDFIVKLVLYKFPERLNQAFEESNGAKLPEGGSVRGFAVVNPNEDVCYVHLIAADLWDDRESMAIMGHEIYHCTLADHKDEVILNDIAEVEDEVEDNEQTLGDIEDLYATDRKLEIEWLKEEYEDMGIKIDYL